MDLGNLAKFSVRMTLVMVVLLIAYLAWIFSSRKTKPPAPRFDPVAKELATDDLKILQFYATPREGKTLLCYGVLNAATVRIDPPVEELKPSLNRCFEVAPRKTTTYTLHAESSGGAKAEAQLVVPPR